MLKPMSICNTLIHVMTNILIVLLIICSSEQNQAPCNTFILFFPHHFQLTRVYWIGNYVGKCSHIGGGR
jgi:hypothetical protein